MNVKELIQKAYAEDLPNGDLTTDNLDLGERPGRAKLIAKEDLILCARDLFEACVHHMDPNAEVLWQFKDGDLVLNQQTVASIKGDLTKLLKAERVALNFIGHLSGIATLTRCFVDAARGTKCKILDTRKTTPLLRELEKSAVSCGGGYNHRRSLSAAVLIKENHIRAAGGMRPAIAAIRRKLSGMIEIECRTLEEVDIAVRERVTRILLDNMSVEQMRQARQRIPAFIEVEASGNMTLERVPVVASLGVDYISVGALTHSAPCADFSLMFDWPGPGGEP